MDWGYGVITCESGPFGGVHMNMMAIRDVLIPNNGSGNTGAAMRAFKMLHKLALELLGEAIDEALGIVAQHLHLALVPVREAVTLEAVLVAALFLAHLTIPLELLQSLRLDPVGDRLRRQKLVLPHPSSSSLATLD